MFKAAGVALNSLMNSYPDSEKSDQYKLLIIKSDYQYATAERGRKERKTVLRQVVTQCNEFIDRFPDSKLTKSVQEYLNLSQNNIKAVKK